MSTDQTKAPSKALTSASAMQAILEAGQGEDWQAFLLETMRSISSPLAAKMLTQVGLTKDTKEHYRLLEQGCTRPQNGAWVCDIREAFDSLPSRLLPQDYKFNMPMSLSDDGHWDNVDWVRGALIKQGLLDVEVDVLATLTAIKSPEHFMKTNTKMIEYCAKSILALDLSTERAKIEEIKDLVKKHLVEKYGKDGKWTLTNMAQSFAQSRKDARRPTAQRSGVEMYPSVGNRDAQGDRYLQSEELTTQAGSDRTEGVLYHDGLNVASDRQPLPCIAGVLQWIGFVSTFLQDKICNASQDGPSRQRQRWSRSVTPWIARGQGNQDRVIKCAQIRPSSSGSLVPVGREAREACRAVNAKSAVERTRWCFATAWRQPESLDLIDPDARPLSRVCPGGMASHRHTTQHDSVESVPPAVDYGRRADGQTSGDEAEGLGVRPIIRGGSLVKIEIRIVPQSSRLILEPEKHAGPAGRADSELHRSDGAAFVITHWAKAGFSLAMLIQQEVENGMD
ncbi:hypothetical protein DHEL01_v201616 [Diaporthe helianthi]|uniref:Uncharacterized protein n=1 Tax=Diaporthe helianthi TaxID=158607 RepID=A0A2P5IBU7_DIAHE|nr:hypothetical protein DHEL01_v201616 [Diaporthe helianthi]